MHYTRVNPLPEGSTRYLASTAVFLVEVIKLTISLTLTTISLRRTEPTISSYRIPSRILYQTFSGDSWKLTIPAALYTLQSSLLYTAISNLSPATFQVTYQLKILTTVLFSVQLLGKQLTPLRWFSLILLTIGIAIVQIPDSISFRSILSAGIYSPKLIERTKNTIAGFVSLATTADGGGGMNPSLGFLAVLSASLISGLTGVYFEKVIKDPSSATISIWTRNVQLSFYSLFPALLIGVLYRDGAEISENGFLAGYTGLVWVTVLLQVMGGITVAVCISYTDNIIKNFATSFSIVASAAIGVWVFGSPITGNVSFSSSNPFQVKRFYGFEDSVNEEMLTGEMDSSWVERR